MRELLTLLALNVSMLAMVQTKSVAQGDWQASTKEDIQSALNVHNEARREVGVNPLIWSDELAKEATEYAEKLARMDQLKHSTCDEGENLYWCSWTNGTPLTAASKSWYEEIEHYERTKLTLQNYKGTGHYTQMVWSYTKKVGIGYAIASDGSTYVVARYDPPGNLIGAYPY